MTEYHFSLCMFKLCVIFFSSSCVERHSFQWAHGEQASKSAGIQNSISDLAGYI